MRRIIVTAKQMPLLKEDTTTIQVPTDNNDAAAALSKGNVQSNINNAQTTFGGNVTAQFNPSDGPGDTTITIPNANGGINGAAEALKDNSAEVGKALSSDMNVGVDVSEGKSFNKKDIEEARLKKMRDEGTVMTKKQLQESFIEEDDSAELRNQIRQIRDDRAFKAYMAIGGSISDFSGRGNIEDIIIDKYNSVGPDEQERFKCILNGNEKPKEEPIDLGFDFDSECSILQEVKERGNMLSERDKYEIERRLKQSIHENIDHMCASLDNRQLNESIVFAERLKRCCEGLKNIYQ